MASGLRPKYYWLSKGRLAGPWVDELECQWRRMRATAAERPIRVDLSGVTGIDGAARYLLQLMRVRNVSLVDASLHVRASLDDEAASTLERHRTLSTFQNLLPRRSTCATINSTI